MKRQIIPTLLGVAVICSLYGLGVVFLVDETSRLLTKLFGV